MKMLLYTEKCRKYIISFGLRVWHLYVAPSGVTGTAVRFRGDPDSFSEHRGQLLSD